MRGNSPAWSNSGSFLFTFNGRARLAKWKKESIDVDDFFKENALRRRNEKPYSFCEGHVIFYNVRGFSVHSALTKGMELMKKKGGNKFIHRLHVWLLTVVRHLFIHIQDIQHSSWDSDALFKWIYMIENSSFHSESRKLHTRRMMNTRLHFSQLILQQPFVLQDYNPKSLERRLKMQFVNLKMVSSAALC